MITQQQLKIVPFPGEVRLTGEFTEAVPFAQQPRGAIGAFLPQQGTQSVTFTVEPEFAAEQYELKVEKDKIEIKASGYAGFLYGAITLNMLVAQFGNKIPCVTVADTPTVKHRGAQVCYGQINVEFRKEWLRKHIVELAKLRYNYVYLYLEFDFAFPSLPPVWGRGTMTPDDAKEIVAFAKDYNIKVIPAVNMLGHTADILAVQLFNDFKENNDSEESAKVSAAKALCPNNPAANEFVFRALDDIIDAFNPEIIHIGGDEVETVGGDGYCKAEFEKLGKTGVLLSYFIKLRDYLSAKGVKTGIWGDMLLALSGENRYDGALCDGKYLESNLKMFESLKKDTLIYDWWYVGASEKSIKFFTEKGFDVISSASTHGCMTSLPSLDQTMNIRALFIDAVKYGTAGGLVCDWIYGFGYHGEQAYFNLAAGACMLWSGTGADCFTRTCTREKFEEDYLFVRYGTEDRALLDYYHAAGDINGKLLSKFPANKKGVALRKVLFYTDNPMWCYVKYIHDLDGKLDEYADDVAKLRRLYYAAAHSCRDDGYFYAVKVAAVVHTYILRAVRTFDAFYAEYDAAAKAQYTDKEQFAAHLDKCAGILASLRSAYTEPIKFAAWMHRNLGNEESSIWRVRATRKNLGKLIRFVRHLKDGHRPLPAVIRLSESLFDTDHDTWWKMRDYEWIQESGEFRKYDVDLCRFYEALNWDIK